MTILFNLNSHPPFGVASRPLSAPSPRPNGQLDEALLAMAMVTVNVPEGVYEGQEFLLTYEGQELMVCCPDGCGPGDEITLEVPAVEAPTGACSEAPALVDVCVPEGCFAGMVFTVTFDGTSFDITVPEGVQPGEMLTVEVPASSASTATPSPTKLASIPEQKVSCAPIQEIPDFRHTSSNTSAGPQRVKPPAEKYLKGLDIPVRALSLPRLRHPRTPGPRPPHELDPSECHGRANEC